MDFPMQIETMDLVWSIIYQGVTDYNFYVILYFFLWGSVLS